MQSRLSQAARTQLRSCRPIGARLSAVLVVTALGGSGGAMATKANVLGGPLKSCCTDPMTGWQRDGFCKTDRFDRGVHVVCAEITQEFLTFTKSRGNDLASPAPGFPGLKPGDKWCLCASRWAEAKQAGYAPPVVLAATHARALDFVTLAELTEHAVDAEEAAAEAAAATAAGEGGGVCGSEGPAARQA